MRILMLSRSLPFHQAGGMEEVAWDLACEFVNHGHSVTILTTATPSLRLDSAVEGVRIRCVPAPSGRYSLAWWLRSLHLYRTEFRGNSDVVLSVGGGGRSLGWVRRREGDPTFFVQAHGTSWGEFLSKLSERSLSALLRAPRNVISFVEDLSYRRFDHIIAVGSLVRRDLDRYPTRLVLGSARKHLILNGVSHSRFSFDQVARSALRTELGIPEDSTVILIASRLHPQKGVFESFVAFDHLAAEFSNVHLLVVGNGADYERLRRFAGESLFKERFHFAGGVSRSAMPGFYSVGDVFLFTTKRIEAGTTLSMLEALAAGLPIVASKHVADANSTMIAVDPLSTGSIVGGLRTALRKVGARRISRLPLQSSLSHTATEYIELFKHSIDRR